MKKVLFSFFIILFLPLNIFAYSKNIIPGGESIGIKINTDGLVVVGYYKVNGEYIGKDYIKIGDIIKEVNGESVESINELSKIIIEEKVYDTLVIRNNKEVNTKLVVLEERSNLKTGLYVKDSVIGIGTLSYIDPISKIYGALGHEITLNETGEEAPVRDGDILLSRVNRIDKSRNGYVGSKDASISFGSSIGSIYKNSKSGLFGIYSGSIKNKSTMMVGSFEEIKLGEAFMLTVVSGNEVKPYKIEILEKYPYRRNTQKAFGFEIVDESLLDVSGGIVQGMSGSPIIQDNKIIGVVTNVLVDEVKLGYGNSIINMLIEGEK